jgi:hypothetical protein
MKMAELLRQLADRLDQIEGGSQDKPSAMLDPRSAEPEDDGKFMPPNQQKLELLKKGVGVDSEFDDEGDAELDAVKRNAGVSPAVVHIASDDEPLE